MLKLKLQYFAHLIQRTDSFEKILMLGKIEGRRRGLQRMRWSDASPTWWTWVWVNSGRQWWTGRPGVLQSMGVAKSRSQQSNWTETTLSIKEWHPSIWNTGVKTSLTDSAFLMQRVECIQSSNHSQRGREKHNSDRCEGFWRHAAVTTNRERENSHLHNYKVLP